MACSSCTAHPRSRPNGRAPPDPLTVVAFSFDATVASITDGDTIRVHPHRPTAVTPIDIRLAGINAPEGHQTCSDANGGTIPCGATATAYLASLMRAPFKQCHPYPSLCFPAPPVIRCTTRPAGSNFASSLDPFNRIVATCSAPATPDLSQAMVAAGQARAFMSAAYALDEAVARLGRTGLWNGTFHDPSAWRRANSR